MLEWVLIVIMLTPDTDSITMQEFQGKSACEAAAAWIMENKVKIHTVKTICVRKRMADR